MKSRSKHKVRKLLKPPLLNVARSMGKWKSNDDYLLIQSVLNLSNMRDVFNLTKFANKFTLKELEERWYAILHDAPISSMIYKNIKKLHPDDIIRLNRQIPFNQTEDSLLLNLESTIDDSTNEFFEKLLLENRVYFNESRTSECLRKQFKLLKKLNLLKDQILKREKHQNDDINSKKCINTQVKFSQIEMSLDDEKIYKEIELNEKVESEMKDTYDGLLRQIKRSEADLFLWQSLVDKVTGNVNPFVDSDTLAILFNENLTYSMKSREISIGRNTASTNVDLDLGSLQSNKKISRKQCSIKLIESDVFYLFNHGKMPIFVDGKVILNLCKTQLYDKSIIQIGDINFLFLINYNSVQQISDSNRLFSLI